MKALTSGLARVSTVKLPKQCLEAMVDMVQRRSRSPSCIRNPFSSVYFSNLLFCGRSFVIFRFFPFEQKML